MGKALYRKYRSKNLDEVIGQKHITDSLATAVRNGRISHAYLFTGPRGVGKTSIARILAHQINDLPYEGDETNHLDIIEIDAASNRRIDEIRELKSRVHIAPTQAKYKVYIIDEVHMLTKEAFNALLKTLEEPPSHAVFILATTDAHKLPETIISRTQRFGFKPITKSDLAMQLNSIAKSEKIKISNEALDLIAEHGDGSFRDSISLLDQVQHSADKITADHVNDVLGLAPASMVSEILDALSQSNAKLLHQRLTAAKDNGVQPVQLASQVSAALRQRVIDGSDPEVSGNIINLLKELASLPAHPQPQEGLELVLFDYIFQRMPAALAPQIAQPTVQAHDKPRQKQPVAEKAPKVVSVNRPVAKSASTTGALNHDSWRAVLDTIRVKYNTLYGVIRMANPVFSQDELVLEFKFPFHQKRLKESKNQKILVDTILTITGMTVTINALVNKELETPEAGQPSQEPPELTENGPTEDISAISNIFDGAEVVE
jgi:DNA polymerase III subunit gamma/tau